MTLELLLSRVDWMEESKSEWEALCRDILSTVTLEANKEYFAVLDETWHGRVNEWVERFDALVEKQAQPVLDSERGTVIAEKDDYDNG
jgi:hypothetical protein